MTSAIRHSPFAIEQPELPLGLPPSAAPSLREAYSLTRLAEFGITFDHALTVPHLLLPLTRTAEAIARARSAGTESRSEP